MRPRVLVTRSLAPEVIVDLQAYFDVDANQDDVVLGRDTLIERLADKDGVLTSVGCLIDERVLQGASRLKAVCNMAVGYNNMDLPAFVKRGVIGTNTPDVLTETTADFGWALLMAAARRVRESDAWLREGHWTRWAYDQFLGADLHGTTLGIVGMGRIGQAVARRSRGFDMRLLYCNRNPVATHLVSGGLQTDLETLLANSDHVVITVPYGPQTHHLIGAAQLDSMRPRATLVNLARGGVVDDQALAAALLAGRIGAAGLDVFEGEPMVTPQLLACPTAVLTPHIASASDKTRLRMARLAAANLIAALGFGPQAGHPPNRVV